MSSAKHTPGPWTVSAYPSGLYIRRAGSHGFVAHVFGGVNDKQANANANVMAAAPDLLEALRYIERLASDDDLGGDGVFLVIADRAREAIAKATGADND